MSRMLRSVTLSSILAIAAAASTATAAPLFHGVPNAQDLGATPAATAVTSSIILKVKNPDLLETFVALSQEPLLPTYHRFLSVNEFSAVFSPSKSDIATITRYLASFGI